MTKLSRRGFLFGTTALVAVSSMPAPARIIAGPAEPTMTATAVPAWWLEEAAPVLERAWHDVVMFGRGAYYVAGDGTARHVTLDELDKLDLPST